MFDTMSSFWSGWVMAIVVINYVVIFFLFLWATWVKIPTEKDGTTGHSWSHGEVKESLNDVPKWWFYTSFFSFAFGFVYLVLYPGFGSWKGTLEWTSLQETHEGVVAQNEKMADLIKVIDDLPVLELSKHEDAMRVGKRLFEDNCAACHGYDAKGIQLMGAPDLTDNTWLFGGKVSDVISSIKNGRTGVMPAHRDSLSSDAIRDVSHYVLSLSDSKHDEEAAERGQSTFTTVCAACHMPAGTGMQALGAPDLTDNEWLYGGNLNTIADSVRNGRSGKMPAWGKRLNEQQIKVLAAWVLSHDNTKEALAN